MVMGLNSDAARAVESRCESERSMARAGRGFAGARILTRWRMVQWVEMYLCTYSGTRARTRARRQARTHARTHARVGFRAVW